LGRRRSLARPAPHVATRELITFLDLEGRMGKSLGESSRLVMSLAALAGIACTAASGFGGVTNVSAVAELDPNPSNLSITQVGNTTLGAAQTNVAAAYAAGIGGTLNFQELYAGGSFPNQVGPTNGITIGSGSANAVTASVGASAGVFSFYRNTTTDGGGAGIDANTYAQGSNVISGGYESADPGTAGTPPSNVNGDGNPVTGYVDFTTTPPTPTTSADTSATGGVGGGYMGISNGTTTATFAFTTPLSFFGITAIPRTDHPGRDTEITLTETSLTGSGTEFVEIGGSSGDVTVGTAAVFFGQTADAGFEITGAAISSPSAGAVNRYDDLAFIDEATAAAPEPTSLVLLGLGGVPVLLRRRRRA
jgi:hypothetical protein